MQHSYGFDNSLQHVFVECQPSSCFPPPSIGDCILTGGDPIPEKRGHPPWPVWENDIDAHKHPIFYNNAREGSRPRENAAEGLTSYASGRVNCGSPGRSSTARFGGVTVVLAAMPSRYSMTRFGGVTVVLAGVGSEAMPSRYSMARFGGVTVVLADKHASSGRCRPHDRNETGKDNMSIGKKVSTFEIEQSWRPKLRRWIRSTTWCSTCCRVTLKRSTARIRSSKTKTNHCSRSKAPMQRRRCFQLVERMFQHVRLGSIGSSQVKLATPVKRSPLDTGL
ncbi:BZ3500_MvSof-1268-A1-R1_Chr6-3g08956 [Microbotryum saponariae]|uniref:BZ3500_MvSof-1268-A1-R1_Chr6-3g08956 protein n=1 Tax=Microbotryum saponariae TaxID=289078 RepID=A0A2X0LQ59_9BASI|nr:BZ3500_MvSof-1268-A1-R1_Chr6-3g08956 [Microbotryum saponariae]SDA07558.1 BZ3501_MvSof-1269-A2-R1_Chr6-2g08660 [Microbotryum saponariae]